MYDYLIYVMQCILENEYLTNIALQHIMVDCELYSSEIKRADLYSNCIRSILQWQYERMIIATNLKNGVNTEKSNQVKRILKDINNYSGWNFFRVQCRKVHGQ